MYGNYVTYPPTTSYLHNQTSQQSQYDNSYSQVLTDYAANQYNQKQQQYPQGSLSNKMQASGKWNAKKKTPYSKPSNANLFYCETCKISCAGEQTYKEHCDGQKHKKKELNLKNNPSSSSTTGNQQKSTSSYFCDLCSVPCSGLDSFNAHLNGKAHIKVCNLQAKLGKEVPQDLIAPIMKPTTTIHQPLNQLMNAPATSSKVNENTIKVIGTPVINFIKGGSLKTMTSDADAVMIEEVKVERNGEQQTNGENKREDNSSVLDSSVSGQNGDQTGQTSNNEISNLINNSMSNDIPLLGDPPQHDSSLLNYSTDSLASAEPIGLEYISEYNLPNSKATYYSCSLCNCKFSEIIAKEQHVRGKRHHKNYKSQNKSRTKTALQTRSSPIAKPISATKTPLSKSVKKFSGLKGRPPSFSQLLNQLPGNQAPANQSPGTNTPIDIQLDEPDLTDPLYPFQTNMDLSSVEDTFTEYKYQSNDNRYLFKKHSEIVPREDDLKQYYKHISNVEKALKQVSDDFLQNNDCLKGILLDSQLTAGARILQGEIRAGLFGKKLLLRDERQIDLILFCSVKVTVPLLRKLIEVLSVKMESYADESYKLEENIEEAAIDVKASNDLTIRITLTSLLIRDLNVPSEVRETEENKDPDQMLDRQKMLDALTALRRFKWYQAKIAPFNPCPMIVRLLRDLTKRVDALKPFTSWTLELICERVMSNCLNRPTPIEAFKLILQTLASGILFRENKEDILIVDPCEMERIDSLDYLTDKQRKEITESAQTLVQFITFNKIYKVLDTEVIKTTEDDQVNGKVEDVKVEDAKAEEKKNDQTENITTKNSMDDK